MAHPEFHMKGDKNDVRGILPVYPLTEGLNQANMRSWQLAVKDTASQIEEWLPENILKEYKLCSLSYAIENIL